MVFEDALTAAVPSEAGFPCITKAFGLVSVKLFAELQRNGSDHIYSSSHSKSH